MKFKTDKEIIDFILQNKDNRRKILINLGKDYFLIGARYRFLIDRTVEDNQINLIFNKQDKSKLEYISIYNRKDNQSQKTEMI